jgi:ParB-like chromosome segregation protein Spo0J
MTQPIDHITWLEPAELKANDYNPNVVFNAELNLLELSIVKHGWLHPLIVDEDTREIIDGFHRWSLAQYSKKIQEAHGTKVPCEILKLTVPERMLLTVRINRAKGSHIALKMSELVHALVDTHGYSIEQVAKEIGGSKEEVQLLLQDNVFKKKDTQNHKFSKAWKPRMAIAPATPITE